MSRSHASPSHNPTPATPEASHAPIPAPPGPSDHKPTPPSAQSVFQIVHPAPVNLHSYPQERSADVTRFPVVLLAHESARQGGPYLEISLCSSNHRRQR